MGRPRKEQVVSKSDEMYIKGLQDELINQSEELDDCKNMLANTQTAYSELLDIIGSRNEDQDFWIDKFDKLSKEHDDVFEFLYETVQKMKEAFKKGAVMTGEITLEDAEYHMNLILRLVAHKFLQEEKEN
jgi:hypothetical protein